MLTLDAAFRTSLAPEAEFVLLGARTRLEGAHRARWEELLGAELSWEQVISLAASHRVLGLLGRHLSARNWRNVPVWVCQHVQNYFRVVALQANALKSELADVTSALEGASIPVVSFKGPTLAFELYGNGVVRPSADLDILVSRGDVGRAGEVLRAAGYAPETQFSPAQEKVHLRLDSVLNWHRAAPPGTLIPQGFAVELHWAITSPCLPFKLDYHVVEPQLKKLCLPGVAPEKALVRSLASEDLLLILCVHGAKHLWERLIWLCDIAEMVTKTPELDWARVMRLAQERGVLRMTILALVLARDVLGTPLPGEVQNWFTTQPAALRIAATLRASLLRHPSGETWDGALTHNLSTDRLLMQTIDKPLSRLGFLWHLATTPPASERASVAAPRGFNSLWWVLRPARALQKRWALGKAPGKN